MNKTNYITDQQMIDRGFRKRKNYGKKQMGISSLSWFIGGHPIFSMEKFDNEDFFRPTIRIEYVVRHFQSMDQVNDFITLFQLECMIRD